MRRVTTGKTLILSDGGLGSLIAVAAETAAMVAVGRDGGEQEPEDVAVAFFPWHDVDAEAAKASVERHCSLFGASLAHVPRIGAGKSGGLVSEGCRLSVNLLAAAGAGASMGRRRIVWPVIAGAGESPDAPDLDAMSSAVDRSILVSRLASLDEFLAGHDEVKIETPYLDLTEGQAAELAVDLSVPVETCWWWGTGDSGERSRWASALTEAGWVPPVKG